MRPTRPWMALAGAGLIAALVTGCGGGGDDEPAAPKPSIDESIEVTPGAVTVSSAGAPVGLDDATRDQIIDTVKRYVQAGTVDPLRTGRGAKEIGPIFSAAAAARAEGPDRAVVVDEGLPRATTDITAKAAPVGITVLADRDGNLVLASAGLELNVDTDTERGPVEIRRIGQLLLAPDAGVWKVAGFDLFVSRTGKGVTAAEKATTSTTAKDGT